MSEAIVPYGDIERMAGAICKSQLFGIKTPEQAIALMLIAQAEGLHPALAARDYHIIQNRPALKADAILARYQAAGGKVEWTEYTDTAVAGVFSHPASPRPITVRWTMEDAKRAGLTGKDNWRNYPRQMLRSRVVSEGVRTTFPGVTVGTYTVEEVQDMDPLPASVRPQAPPIDVTATSTAPADADADLLLAISEADKSALKIIADEIRASGKPASRAVRDAWLARSKTLGNGGAA